MSYNNITMLQIRYFLAVAKCGSFTKAAQELFTSQSSMSRQISLLEKQIGVTLFYRTKRTVRMTAAGETLYSDLADILDRITDAIASASSMSDKEKNSIKVGVYIELASGNALTEVLRRFSVENPGINIEFEAHSWLALREKLRADNLDVILTLGFEIVDSEYMNNMVLKSLNTCIIMSADHPMAKRKTVSLDSLSQEDFLFLNDQESPGGRRASMELCKKYGFVPKIANQLPNVESLLMAVQAGKGITILDNTDRAYSLKNLKRYVVEDDIIDIIGVWKKNNDKPAVQLFLERLRDHLSDIEL